MEFDSFRQIMDAKRRVHVNGSEYWYAREIQTELGYDTWEKFDKSIGRAIEACQNAGYVPKRHFRGAAKKVSLGRPAADYVLSRYACYLIAMNADSRKPEIANAQTYFAYQTRKQELTEDMLAMIARLDKRQVTGIHLKQLNGVAKKSGVTRFGVFQDRGNYTMYGMSTRDVKARKRIPQNETILDYAGIAELSAHDFRYTQTTAVLAKLQIRNEQQAIAVHERVGRNVRKAMEDNGSIMPEDLPAESHIKFIERAVKVSKELPPNDEIMRPV